MKEGGGLLRRFVAAVIPILVVAAVLTGCASRGAEWNIQNPYAGVDWTRYQQHKANFHTHTTMSDGSGTPYRVRVSPPCFAIMAALSELIQGGLLSDIIATFGSVNMIGGELDR